MHDEQQTDAISRLRNVGIVAHINAGKTTLSERILFDTGRQRFCGDVDSGTATMDWLREEQERGISIAAAVTNVAWRDHRIQLIDTPGHVDFTAEVERCLRVLDGAIVLLDGVRGVESQTEAVWRQLDRFEVPRIVFVNKLDRPIADFDGCLAALGEVLGAVALPVVVPLLHDGALGGLVDTVGGRFVTWEAAAPDRELVRTLCSDTLARTGELDDQVLAAFVEGRTVEPEVLHRAIRRATLERRVVPVFCGSALANRGVEPLLDGVCRYLPSPFDRSVAGLDAGAGFVGLVFKAFVDPDDGPVALVRVYRGTLERGTVVETAGSGTRFRAENLWELHAFERTEVVRAGPGDIVAVQTPAVLRTGETLREPGGSSEVEPLRFSPPVLTVAFEPRTSEDAPALEARARALAAEDPTLAVTRDPATGELLVSGMGELHLEIFAERLSRALGHEVRRGRPSVVRYETVAASGRGEAVCERHLPSGVIRASAVVHVEPAADPATVPLRWAAVEDGPRASVLSELEALAASGIDGRRPLRGVVVEVRHVEQHGAAELVAPLLQEAVGLACARAIAAAEPRVVEPRVRFEVATPVETSQPVIADLRARGARLDAFETSPDEVRILGRAFLDRMLGYATPLRSMTRGKGRVALQFDGFEVRTDAEG